MPAGIKFNDFEFHGKPNGSKSTHKVPTASEFDKIHTFIAHLKL